MAKTATKNYKQLANQLAEILDWFESDQVDLDQAIAKYEAATGLISQMEAYLKSAENKVRKVTAKQ